jgi:hypothetical protein
MVLDLTMDYIKEYLMPRVSRGFWCSSSSNLINRPILSIGIPTYNRPDMIFGMINDLVEFANRFEISSHVEIIICDNNSTNYPEDLIDYNRLKGYGINFIKSQKNIGMSANIVKTIELSSGKYYYFIADDERFNLDSLNKLVGYLLTSTLSVLITKSPASPGYSPKCYLGPELSLSLINGVDNLNLYYIGNALSVVNTELLKKGISNFQNKLLDIQIPQTVLIAYAINMEQMAGYLNLSILRQDLGAEYINKVITASSYLSSGLLLNLKAEKILIDGGVQFNPKNYKNRHHNLLLFKDGFIKFAILLFLLYTMADSKHERASFRYALKNEKILPFFNCIILKIMVHPKVCNKILFVLKVFAAALPSTRLANVFRIYSEYKKYKEQMLKNNRNVHDWGQGIGLPDG